MNTLLVSIFTGQTAEFNSLASNNIDFDDSPLSPAQIGTLGGSLNSYYVTSPIQQHGYAEVEFNLAKNFWGIPMMFGGSVPGLELRRGMAHLVDKNVLTGVPLNDGCPAVSQFCPIDNPVPPSDLLPTPDACVWDNSPGIPAETWPSPPCATVGNFPAPQTGGTAYHIAPSTASPCLGGNQCAPFPWQPQIGSPDFCAAARHFFNAGLAGGIPIGNCVLTAFGLNVPLVTSSPVNFYARVDSPSKFMLSGIAQAVCAVFTGFYSTGCNINSPGASRITSSTTSFIPGDILTVTFGPIAAFPGFATSNILNLSWGMYTADFEEVFPFDASLYYTYNSHLVSPPGAPCTSTISSLRARNYMYLCVPTYDNWSKQTEFAPCISISGDPVPGTATGLYVPNLGPCNALWALATWVLFSLASAQRSALATWPRTHSEREPSPYRSGAA